MTFCEVLIFWKEAYNHGLFNSLQGKTDLSHSPLKLLTKLGFSPDRFFNWLKDYYEASNEIVDISHRLDFPTDYKPNENKNIVKFDLYGDDKDNHYLHWLHEQITRIKRLEECGHLREDILNMDYVDANYLFYLSFDGRPV